MPQLRGKRGAPSSAADDAAREDLFRRKLSKKHGDESVGTSSRTATAHSEAEAPSTPQKSQPKEKNESPSGRGSEAGIWVNRAPVLTLWVAKVAEREGFSREAGLSFGKRIAGMMAQSKGRRIGVFEEHEADSDKEKARERAEEEEKAGVRKVDVFGMHVKALDVGKGELRAFEGDLKPIDPKKVETYLQKAFGTRFADAESALTSLAAAFAPEEIGKQAYSLYAQFRPSIPDGQAGWGKRGLFEISKLQELV